jgi:hypothetical protein
MVVLTEVAEANRERHGYPFLTGGPWRALYTCWTALGTFLRATFMQNTSPTNSR